MGRRSLRERILAPAGFDALILATNLATGVIIARKLGPAGRGELAAILILVQMATWLFCLGSTEAIAFRQSREPKAGGSLISSWLALTAVMGMAAILIGELLLPTLFNAQTGETIAIARVYLLTIFVTLGVTLFNGVLLGDQSFRVYNIARTVTPAGIAIGYVGLLACGSLSVEGALIANAIANGLGLMIGAFYCLRRHRLAAPDWTLLRETLSFGVKAHAGSVAGLVNARLDLLIIPAFLPAASVGLYSIATNASSIIATLTGTIATFVLPVAARRQKGSARTVVRTLHAVLAIGALIAVPLMALAEFALTTIYGTAFGEASTALRILLPGEVLEACSVVLWAGLLALNRPFLSTLAAGPGALVTVIGLVAFLESGGINAAAIVTSCAYTLVFVLTLILFRRAAGIRWREFIVPPAAEATGAG